MQQRDCPCSGETLDRFLRPTVMAVLAGAPEGLHGYRIAQELRHVPIFKDCAPDAAGLYRLLKTMETEGYLESTWDVEGTGPARRIYALTASGVDCLYRWGDTLATYSKLLQQTTRFVLRSVAQTQAEELP